MRGGGHGKGSKDRVSNRCLAAHGSSTLLTTHGNRGPMAFLPKSQRSKPRPKSRSDGEAAQEERRTGARAPDSPQGDKSNLNGQGDLGFGRHGYGGEESHTISC